MDFHDIIINILYYCCPRSQLQLKLVSSEYKYLIETFTLKNYEPQTISYHLGKMIDSTNHHAPEPLFSHYISGCISLDFFKNGWYLTLDRSKTIIVSDDFGSKTNFGANILVDDCFRGEKYYYMETHHNTMICLLTFEKSSFFVRWAISINKCTWFANEILGWTLPKSSDYYHSWLFNDFALFYKEDQNFLRCLKVDSHGNESHFDVQTNKTTNHTFANYYPIRQLQNHVDSPCFLKNGIGRYCVFFHKSKKIWFFSSLNDIVIIRSPLHGTFDMCAFFFKKIHLEFIFWFNDKGEIFISSLSKPRYPNETELYIINNCMLYSILKPRFLQFESLVLSKFTPNYYGITLKEFSN
jgi:hypothetical protein